MALFPCHHSLILKGRWINLKWKLDLITIFMWTVCSLPSALRIKSKLHDMLWNSFTPQPICYRSLNFLGDLGKKPHLITPELPVCYTPLMSSHSILLLSLLWRYHGHFVMPANSSETGLCWFLIHLLQCLANKVFNICLLD